MLDVGCGTGVDTLIAGTMLGEKGKAIGIDIVPEMLRRAQENLRITELNNVSFCEASGEELPFSEASFDFLEGVSSAETIFGNSLAFFSVIE